MKQELKSAVEIKAEQLSLEHGTPVIPIVFKDETTDEDVVGFIKEPNRMTKLRVMDKAITQSMTAAAELFEAIFLPTESDPRIMADDKYYLGAVMEAFKTVEIAVSTFKKK